MTRLQPQMTHFLANTRHHNHDTKTTSIVTVCLFKSFPRKVRGVIIEIFSNSLGNMIMGMGRNLLNCRIKCLDRTEDGFVTLYNV